MTSHQCDIVPENPPSLSREQQYLGDAELGGEGVEAARDGLEVRGEEGGVVLGQPLAAVRAEVQRVDVLEAWSQTGHRLITDWSQTGHQSPPLTWKYFSHFSAFSKGTFSSSWLLRSSLM